MRVVVLHDKVAQEATLDASDVLVQVETVLAALRSQGHDADTLEFGLGLDTVARELRSRRPDVVFNLVEAVAGLGRLAHLAPALLDSVGLPYTGAPADALFLASNKLVAKRLLAAAGIATPPWYDLPSLRAGTSVRAGCYLIKSVWEHASIGIDDSSLLDAADPETLADAITRRLSVLGGEGFAERYVEGREFNLSLLEVEEESRVLPPAEMLFEGFPTGKPRLVGYRAKWEIGSFEFDHTVRTFDFREEDLPLVARVSEIALRCWHFIGLRGYARVDFRVDEWGRPWVLDVNANPCISPGGGFDAAVERAGFGLPEAIHQILEASAVGLIGARADRAIPSGARPPG